VLQPEIRCTLLDANLLVAKQATSRAALMNSGSEVALEDRDPIAKRAFGGLLWAITGTGVQNVVRLLTTLVLARLISPADFGLMAAATSVVGLTDVFAQIGVGSALVQLPRLEARHLATGSTISLIFGATFCLSTFLLAPALAQFFHTDALADLLRTLAFLFPLRALAVVSTSMLRRNLKFRQIAFSEVVAFTSSYGGVAIVLGLLHFGVWALASALLADGVIRTGIALWLSPPPWRLGRDLAAARQLVSRGVSFTLAQIFSMVALKGDNVVVGRWLGPESLGFYSRAYTLMTIPVDLLSSITQRVLFPAMSKLQGDTARLTNTYKRGISLLAVSLLPLGVLMFVLSDEVIALLLGPAWSSASAALRFLVFGIYFRGSYKLSGTIADATGAAHRTAWVQLIYAILVVAGAWIGQHWGMTGVAAAVTAVLGIEFLLLSSVALDILAMPWSVFVGLHLRGIGVAVLTFVAAAPIAWMSRAHGNPPVLTAVLTSAGCGTIGLLLLMSVPRILLGPSEVWLVRMLDDQLGHKAPGARRVLQRLLTRVT
jgi:teichuronic acid exporter